MHDNALTKGWNWNVHSPNIAYFCSKISCTNVYVTQSYASALSELLRIKVCKRELDSTHSNLNHIY